MIPLWSRTVEVIKYFCYMITPHMEREGEGIEGGKRREREREREFIKKVRLKNKGKKQNMKTKQQ